MLVNTWHMIFNTLIYVGVFGVVIYYINPNFLSVVKSDGQTIDPLFICFLIYVAIWLIVLILYYFFNTKSNAQIEGLWRLAPLNSGKSELYDFNAYKMMKQSGTLELLSESESTKFLAETFTFGFYISIDNTSIEIINGEALGKDKKPYQLIISIPGVYGIYIDPFHETLAISFSSYKAKPYVVYLPTLKVHRWHQILISMEGRSADIYQNGILLKSIGLQNVVSSHPGKPTINMNPNMYSSVAFIQSWPIRLKEQDIVDNYRWTSDAKGIPSMPSPTTDISTNLSLALNKFPQ